MKELQLIDTYDLKQATSFQLSQTDMNTANASTIFTKQNSSLAQAGWQVTQPLQSYDALTHATLYVQNLHTPIHLSFQWATTYAYDFKVKGLVPKKKKKACLDAEEADEDLMA